MESEVNVIAPCAWLKGSGVQGNAEFWNDPHTKRTLPQRCPCLPLPFWRKLYIIESFNFYFATPPPQEPLVHLGRRCLSGEV